MAAEPLAVLQFRVGGLNVALSATSRVIDRSTRRCALVAAAGAWLGGLLPHALSQAQDKTHRIGYLGYTAVNTPDDERSVAALLQGLREHGLVVGGNLVIEWRYAEGQDERYDQFAAEFAQQGIEMVVVGSGSAARAVMKASPATPVVTIAVPDPVRSGLVKSLAHPGGQVTGISNLSDDLTPKRLELLKKAVPAATQIAIVRCPRCVRDAGQSNDQVQAMYEAQGAAARSLGIQLISLELDDKSAFGSVAEVVSRHRPNAMLINATQVNAALRPELLALAATHRLPTMGPNRGFGAMLSYGPDYVAINRLAADYVARIFNGSKPADLPMQQPTVFEFVVNLRVAKSIGATVPRTVLLQADEVID